MKKLFMFLAVAGLATFGASCSSDDGGKGNGGGDDPKTLTLSADKTSVKVNETVTFTVSEKDAEIYVEGEKISSKSTKFDEEGSYKVVAKKNGFKESNVVTIKVTKDGTPGDGNPGDGEDGEKKTLTLTIAPAEVTLGQSVTFIVMEGTTNVTADAEIYVDGALNSGSTYTATEVGEYTVVAKKEGANDSVEKTFTVVEGANVPESNFLRIGNDFFNVAGVACVQYLTADGSSLYTMPLQDGRIVTVYAFTSFKDNIDSGSIEVEFWENHAELQVFVVQDNPEETMYPWTPGATILFTAFDGEIEAEAWEGSDDMTLTGNGLQIGAPATVGNLAQGDIKFGVNGATTAGSELEFDYDGKYIGFLSRRVPDAARGIKGINTDNTALKASNKVYEIKR